MNFITQKQVTIVVPTYNEKGNIRKVYEQIYRTSDNYRLLIVDDNSPDGTGKIADELARDDSRLEVLHRVGKLGLGSAYIHGIQRALASGAEVVVAMDADLSHDPANLPKMIQLIDDYDLVIGSRYVKDGGMVNWGVGRFFISRLANNFCRAVLAIPQQDCSGGYKCYRAELLNKIGIENIFSKGYSFQVEILFRAIRNNARIIEVPIIFVNRHEGESKLSFKELTQFAWTVIKLRWFDWIGKL